MPEEKLDFDENQLPTKEGVYSVRRVLAIDFLTKEPEYEEQEIDVYQHPIKGLCCFADDFGSAGSGVDDETDCHVSVQLTGLEFISRVGDLY